MTRLLSLLFFITMSCQAIEPTPKYDFIVAQDGTGNFTTVQAAINAVPDFRRQRTVIFIKKGTYKEKIVLPESKSMVSLLGESATETILTFDDFAQKKNAFGEEMGTTGSSSFFLFGTDFYAENITFENSAGPVGQAVAMRVNGDRCHFHRCRFLGFQDTLYTYAIGSRQYYSACYIEGTVDFIFGSSIAFFENCTIHSKKTGFVTAASTPENQTFGYVFSHCKLTGESNSPTHFLGRPWRPFAKTVFISCDLGAHIQPTGWNNWGKESNEKTTYYGEYKNYGEGAKDKSKRVSWAKQLTDEEANTYQRKTVFGDWEPVIP